ncbi:MAG TPA: XrtA/PEP-CTERM system amidotransferase [Micropepsaceae bacterium]|nr:XrtA/PEP-CTERM system amidotransferase [Micropepsaceae bacterium]
MCGISGWFDTVHERAPNRGVVQTMTDAIAHRGPDGEGFHYGTGIALGHRRLAIIDLATGDQPMFNAKGTVALVFNGEIYNFRELRQELIARHHRFVTSSDTEVIIHAWEEWGDACMERLAGMFAFALWDETAKTLFLARDRLGEKPLYYSLLPDQTLIFGSELKALLAHPSLQRRIDPCAIEEFFALGYIAEPRTIYEDVSRLPPGSCLTLKRGARPVLRRYWEPKPTEHVSGNSRAIADSLIERLGAAVQSQLVSDVPIGAFLSGGVDSSGTMALMAKATPSPIHCFTIGFGDPRFDETAYASTVAKRYGAYHFVERMMGTETDLVSRLPRIFDEPFGDSSALPSYFLMQLARKNVTVALSGDAGDELFAGYRRYLFHANEERIRNIFPNWFRHSFFGLLGRVYPQLDWAPKALRARHTFQELSLDPAMGYFHNLSVTDDVTRKRLFSQSLRGSLSGYHASEVVQQHWGNAPDRDPIAVAQYVDLKTWLPGDILTKVDRTAMACSLEVRVPMLDHRFVEWALGLPRAMKIANGQSKFILKRAFERLVPNEVLYRPKQGFSVPLASWFRGPLGENFSRDISGRSGLANSGYFDGRMIGKLIEQHRSGLSDHSRILWLLWMFQGFLNDVHAPAPVHA